MLGRDILFWLCPLSLCFPLPKVSHRPPCAPCHGVQPCHRLTTVALAYHRRKTETIANVVNFSSRKLFFPPGILSQKWKAGRHQYIACLSIRTSTLKEGTAVSHCWDGQDLEQFGGCRVSQQVSVVLVCQEPEGICTASVLLTCLFDTVFLTWYRQNVYRALSSCKIVPPTSGR